MPKSQLRIIAINIKKFRLSQKLSQADLAEKAGTTQRIISQIENHLYNPSVKYLERIAEVLKIELADILVSQD